MSDWGECDSCGRPYGLPAPGTVEAIIGQGRKCHLNEFFRKWPDDLASASAILMALIRSGEVELDSERYLKWTGLHEES